jgi:membrane protease YdiL (CAAX protease family)
MAVAHPQIRWALGRDVGRQSGESKKGKGNMPYLSLFQSGWPKKGLVFLLFFVLELMVFAILPLSARLPIDPLLYIQAGITAMLLLAALILQRSEAGKPYWQVCYALFAAALAVLLSTLFGGKLLELFGLTPVNPQGIALAKLSESLWRVIPILVLMAVVGAGRQSMYLTKGKIALGLAIGVAGFVGFAALAFIPLVSRGGMLNKLLSLSPWILIFVLSNGFMEELLYRGLFLKRYEVFLGKGLSNILAAVVFTLVHLQVTYVSDLSKFLFILFPLALVWGYLMQKTDSLWGSVIFHAGADCMIIFGIFASM